MPTLLFAILILVILLWGASAFTKANPRRLGIWVRRVGGIGAIGLAAFLGLRGQWPLAVPLGLAGLSLLGFNPFVPAGFGQRTQKQPGQVSRVRSPFVEMELDHDSGAMHGRILAGRYEGVALEALDAATLAELLPGVDEESQALLMAYLDRRHPGWREHTQTDTAAGRVPPGSGKMTEEEAYQILGVQPGASPEEIGRAHRSLMKKLHPDQGGSTYLAARVNEAKEVLLRRHR